MEGESPTGSGPEQGGIRQNLRNLRSTVEGIPDKGVEVASVAVEKSRKPAALFGRSVLGVIGAITLALASFLLFNIYAGDGFCADTNGWAESVSCQAGSWLLLLLLAAVAALTLPGPIIGIKGRRGAIALLVNVPFLLLTGAGLGLLFANLGPLGVMLQHEDAGWFILAVVTLAVGLPVAVRLIWRQVMYTKEEQFRAASVDDSGSAEPSTSE